MTRHVSRNAKIGMTYRERGQIVVCDDDPEEMLFFQYSINIIGLDYDVKWIPTGSELLKYLSCSRELPDIIFLDNMIPGSPMVETINKIRSEYKDIPIVVHSAAATDAEIEKAFEAGATRYIRKTSSPKRFRAILKKLFKMDRSELARVDKANFYLMESE